MSPSQLHHGKLISWLRTEEDVRMYVLYQVETGVDVTDRGEPYYSVGHLDSLHGFLPGGFIIDAALKSRVRELLPSTEACLSLP